MNHKKRNRLDRDFKTIETYSSKNTNRGTKVKRLPKVWHVDLGNMSLDMTKNAVQQIANTITNDK